MTSNQLTDTARELGVKAFLAGAQCIPAHDPAVLPLLKGQQVGDSLPVLSAWLAGWHRANLSDAGTYCNPVASIKREYRGEVRRGRRRHFSTVVTFADTYAVKIDDEVTREASVHLAAKIEAQYNRARLLAEGKL